MILLVRHGESATVDPDGTNRASRGWVTYVDVTVKRLARDFPGADIGTDIAIASDLPRAAGLRSSSALVWKRARTAIAGVKARAWAASARS